MRDFVLLAFIAAFLLLGLKRPFVWVLLYLYIDIVTPQKVGWGLIGELHLSLVAFLAAFAGWLFFDSKQGSRLSLRQGLIVALLLWCGFTTVIADYPEAAAAKWDWVWKSLFFAAFLPLTLRTKLRVEAAALIMVLSAASIIISAGIKTVLSGGGYGILVALVQDNSGLYEGSTLSTVAIAIIPLIWWAARHGTIFPRSKLTMALGAALIFAALLVPVGTQTRTGLICIAVLAVLLLRSIRYRFLYAGLGMIALVAALPFLPASYTERMATITEFRADQSASTRVQVWAWTYEYAKQNPLGGGFDAYIGNSFTYETREVKELGNTQVIESQEISEESRAYHSAYFELLGEQGWVGLGLWLWLQLAGLWQMERIQRKLKGSDRPEDRRWRSLAAALQQGQVIYLVGAVFIGVAYQPFMFKLLGLQIALSIILQRQWKRKQEGDQPPAISPSAQAPA